MAPDPTTVPYVLPRARVQDRILRTPDFTPVYVGGDERVDCAYLVTRGTAPWLQTRVDRLAQCARRVVVLSSVPWVPEESRVELPLEVVHFEPSSLTAWSSRSSSLNPTSRWGGSFDVPAKRNFALAHSLRAGYEHILLVDDDIKFRHSFIPSGLAVLRSGAHAACSYALRDPDLSTLDRVRCELGLLRPEVSISGNAVILNPNGPLSFFPDVYNEDWLFFWSSLQHGAVVRAFQNVVQLRPRPGRSDLVRMEQFGELLVSLLFFRDEDTPDLSRLQDPSWVAAGMAEYLSLLQGILRVAPRHPTVEHALSAAHDITVEDVTHFATHYEQELQAHYYRRG